MHTPKMYNSVHFIHHQYCPPFSLAGELQHPIEFVVNILLPLMAGPVRAATLCPSCGGLACRPLLCTCVSLVMSSC